MKQNFWVCRASAFIHWYASLPRPDSAQDIDVLLEFAKDVVELGEQTQIFRLHKAGAENLTSSIGLNYIEYMQDVGERTGTYPFFRLEHYNWHTHEKLGEFFSSSKVCYYNSSNTLEANYIDNLGTLMRRLHPQKVEEYAYSMMNDLPPLRLWSDLIDKPYKGNEPILVEFLIYSDIWLPWLSGSLEENPSRNHAYDNRELAHCHTPRLNQFIRGVRELVAKLKGEWSFYALPAYAAQVTEAGILLR